VENFKQLLCLDTPKTLLVPEELYVEGTETDLLAFGGVAPSAGEVAVASAARDGMVAVMAIPEGDAARLKEQLERGGVSVTSPLLDAACFVGRRRTVNIVLTSTNLYMAVRDGGLQMAEALPDNSPDSLLYCLQMVGQRFKLRRFHIRVSGVNAAEVADALEQYYKRVEVGD